MNDKPGDEERTVYQPAGSGSEDDRAKGAEASNPAAVPPPPAAMPPPTPEPSAPEPSAPVTAKPNSDSQVAIGEVLNGIYKITGFLARGGMGEVYEAVNIHPPSERVAIKVMLQHLAKDEQVSAMFAKEAETLTRLHHEAIVQYRLAARDAEGRPYIVTEFIDGTSLEDMLGKLKLTDEEFASITRKLAAGLGTAHTLGAIHRDIAPDNVLLADNNPARPKIIDFGIAKDARENTATIVGDGFAGKLRYVAPEQLGEYGRNVGPWSDLYSLALTLRAVAAGKHSDMGGSPADAVRKRMSVPDLSDIPERFRPAFEMALQPDPADRPQSMAEFILRLDSADSFSSGNSFQPMARANEEKTTFAPSGTVPPIPDKKTGGALAALIGALPEGLGQNKLVLIGGGVFALVIALVGVLVLTSLGGDEEAPTRDPIAGALPSGDGASGAQGLDVGSPRFAQLAASAAANVDCAWLSYDGASGSTALFKGGAANPAEAQTLLATALEQGGARAPTLDFSNVVRFPAEACAAVNAMRQARSEQALISTPQSSYEASRQAIAVQGGQTLEEDSYAKALIQVANVGPDDEIALITFDTADGFFGFTKDRAETNMYVQFILGDARPNGFEVNYPAELADGRERGLIVITSPDPLPTSIINTTPGQNKDFDEGWAQQFLEGARTNGWKVDAVWFTVEDRQPG